MDASCLWIRTCNTVKTSTFLTSIDSKQSQSKPLTFLGVEIDEMILKLYVKMERAKISKGNLEEAKIGKGLILLHTKTY